MNTQIKTALRYLGLAAPFAMVVLVGVAPPSCNPTKTDWDVGMINRLQTPPDPAMVPCGVVIPKDPYADLRNTCSFEQGDHPSDSLGIPTSISSQIPIRHVIIVMKENRSFDHIFGMLHDQGQPGVVAVPKDYFNPDSQGAPIGPFHSETTCLRFDPLHQSTAVQASLGKRTVGNVTKNYMDGFVKNAANAKDPSYTDDKDPKATTTDGGRFVMGEYDQSDLPFYYWLAKTYPISDAHFAPMAAGTYSNRAFFMLGTNDGVWDTGITPLDPKTDSVFVELMTRHPETPYTWASYTDSEPFSGTFGWTSANPGVHSMEDFYKALKDGTLPNVAFVDGTEGGEDEHPTADVQVGENWTRQIYQAVVASPQWDRTVMFFTYDEAGSFADHVPPPDGCAPSMSENNITARGPRVPLIAVSRWGRHDAKNPKLSYVSHVVHDHTAIMRFIETIFDLPALTARDANSDALMDMFDFSCSQPLHPLEDPPEAGRGGCKATP